MHLNAGSPAKVMLVSRSPELWQEIIRPVLPQGANFVAAESLVDPSSFDTVVLHGTGTTWASTDVERLEAFVSSGGSALLVDALNEDGALERLAGVHAGPRFPKAEYFARPGDASNQLVQRLATEFSVVDAFAPLEVDVHEAQPLMRVNVHFQDRVVLTETSRGGGRIVTSALGADQAAYRSPELQKVLRRAIRPRAESPSHRELNLAIVGYGPRGGMGYSHALAIQATDGLRLAAVCDTSPQRREAAAAQFPNVSLYESAEEVADDPDIDVAIVATPPSMHAEHSLRLLQAGKHVVCEKPLCFTGAEALTLIEEAAKRGRVLSVHQNRRWDVDYLTVRKLIEEGALGEVFNIETFVGSFEHPCREWHSEKTISGGAEYDWGAHYIDWILETMGGLPSLVFGTSHKRVWHDVSNMDQVRVRMVWQDGREAEFVHSDVAAVRRPKFYVQGTEGTLVGHYRPLISERIEPGRGYLREETHHAEAPAELTLARFNPGGSAVQEQRIPLVSEDPFAFHRNLADHLLLNDPLAVSPTQMSNLITVLEAAHESAERGGQPTSLP